MDICVKVLCGCVFSFVLGYIYLTVELLDHIVPTIRGTARLFLELGVPFYNPTSNVWSFPLLHMIANVLSGSQNIKDVRKLDFSSF